MVSQERSKLANTDRKRKATDKAKQSRWESKHQKTDDDTVKARRDYDRHDGGTTVLDIVSDVPQNMLEDLMIKYYQTNVQVTTSKAKELESTTTTQAMEMIL